MGTSFLTVANADCCGGPQAQACSCRGLQHSGEVRQAASKKVHHAEETSPIIDPGWLCHVLKRCHSAGTRASAIVVDDVAKESHVLLPQLTFRSVQLHSRIGQLAESILKMLLLVALDSAENQTVVEERDGVVLILENGHHCTLKYFWSRRDSEGNPTVEVPP